MGRYPSGGCWDGEETAAAPVLLPQVALSLRSTITSLSVRPSAPAKTTRSAREHPTG